MGGRCQGPTREAFAEGSGPALDADSRLTRHDRPYKQSGVIDTGIYGHMGLMPARSVALTAAQLTRSHGATGDIREAKDFARRPDAGSERARDAQGEISWRKAEGLSGVWPWASTPSARVVIGTTGVRRAGVAQIPVAASRRAPSLIRFLLGAR